MMYLRVGVGAETPFCFRVGWCLFCVLFCLFWYWLWPLFLVCCSLCASLDFGFCLRWLLSSITVGTFGLCNTEALFLFADLLLVIRLDFGVLVLVFRILFGFG